jgi:signal transduction histidine kinase
LLLNREFPRPVQRDYLDIIHRQSRRLTQLLSDLLDLARSEARRRGALTLAHHRLDHIVREALAGLLIPGDSRPVTLKIDTPLPMVEVDAAKIQQALTN